jgi:hypothetical protein
MSIPVDDGKTDCAYASNNNSPSNDKEESGIKELDVPNRFNNSDDRVTSLICCIVYPQDVLFKLIEPMYELLISLSFFFIHSYYHHPLAW